MMATEATPQNFATSSITPDHELNTTEAKSQDVPSDKFLSVDGATADKDGSKQDSDSLEVTNNNSAEVSVNGGSDTEATKAETSKIGDDKGSHIRTTSTLKKPVPSFKAVSVNKTFLASKASTAAVPSKVGDKGPAVSSTAPATLSASTSTTPKPRLVAKSGSGLRDSTPRASTTANGGKAGGAPDASAVWNKNRPAAPPEPKRFTDEELKQRYGIHLATRLQSDDPGKQANWADIDDDDDDWAPESIEWTDGTKITLPHADDAPPPPPEPVPEPAPVVKEIKKTEPAPKPSKSPAPQAIAAPAPRLGSGKAGLVLKGAPEKPTLVAKPPGPPTPVKSPWAQLPPVEKVAPVAIDVPQQSQQNRFNQRDPHGFSGMPQPPAKEIAADDFSRTWRESNAHANRELYNSQSGRYEPVNEGRRGVSRSDGQSRGPAVLQRPSHQDGPAEPSAAFQTHHTSAQQGNYGRRRTSSNVSGGSGNFTRRMSRGHDMPPPHEMLNARRGSLAAVSDAPSSPRNFSPSGQNYPNQQHQQRGYQNQSQPWQSRASPAVSHASPHSTYGQLASGSGDMHMHGQGPPQGPPVGAARDDDALEEQKIIMRRTRELAIKRRQEAEAKEEAERKERIRIKLEAMGPPPEKKKVKEEPVKEESVPTSIQSREGKTPVLAKSTETETSNDAHVPKSEITNENDDASYIEGNSTATDSRSNGVFQPSASAPTQHTMPDNRNSQSWQRNSASNYPADRFTSWSAAPPPPQNSSSRIWGPPTNEKTIGNGTFNPELNRLPEMSRQSLSDMPHSSAHPGPIGPPGANRGNGSYQANRGQNQYNSRPPPIGPPSANRVPQPPRSYEDEQRKAMARQVWGGVPDRISQEDAILHQQHQEEMERKRELEAAGIVEELPQPVYEDTWKQVTLNEDGTRSKTKKVSTALVDGRSSTPSVLTENTSRGNARPDLSRTQYNNNSWPGQETNASSAHRESKFFPSHNRDVRLEEMNGHGFERSSSPSPPPPTMDGHPAYDSDFAQPHVALPPPLPVVRLPPPTIVAPIAPPRPTSFAAAAAAPAVPAISQIPGMVARQGLVRAGSTSYDIRRGVPSSTQTGEWKEKIDQLFGKKSPPRTHALAVDSSSRRAFDHSSESHASTATVVSLPGSVNDNLFGEQESLDTKPAAEECFEEQEMGSLPVIKMPQTTPSNAFQLAPPPRNIPRKFLMSDTTSAESMQFPMEISNNFGSLTILLPGQEKSKVVQLLISRTRSNPRRGRGGSRQTSSTHPRGSRGGRDSNNGSSSTPRETPPANTNNTSGRGRGGRGFGNNTSWNRHAATPVHT
ncbi:uncharacterized protein EAF02_010050 [Botrytis sinoallii]|uniref:uncharacterized protein n=1 Tax=Botrytis sinoallii TaxID=1463999 RepID=UPI0019026CBA|nr:uncharacterized protein EAF02_010050 [Botrytis sinoallii]KAF7865627.1 hypothetical protein EAF02_010050 [Botrytis sinoallii]